MLIILRAKNLTSNMRSDVGQYNLVTKTMQLWINSARLVNGATHITIPAFDVPKDVKKVEIKDAGNNSTLVVPVKTFLSSKQENGSFSFEYSDWSKKYRRMI